MRYPVMNLGRQPRMGEVNAAAAARGAASKSFNDLKASAQDFKNSMDKNYPDANAIAQRFNNQMDQAIQNGESGSDLWDALNEAGIPDSYIRNMRPSLLTNEFTHTYYGPKGWGPPGTHSPGEAGPSGGNNPYQAQGMKAGKPTATEGRNPATGMTPEEEAAEASAGGANYNPSEGAMGPTGPAYNPVPAPESTGDTHSYEEEAAQYKQQMEEFQKAREESQKAADEQIKAANESMKARMEEMKAKYESGNPNAVCGPGEFWDGRQCRGSVQGRGGLISQAMNLGPSGGGVPFTGEGLPSGLTEGLTAAGGGLMGHRRFPVVNL